MLEGREGDVLPSITLETMVLTSSISKKMLWTPLRIHLLIIHCYLRWVWNYPGAHY